MKEHLVTTAEVRSDRDLVVARRRTRRIAELLGFERQDQTRVATAVSEIVRNALLYAHDASIAFSIRDAEQPRLVITVKDKGPGVSNLADVLAGRYVSRTGMGVGIVSARRLSDDFQISTGPAGTTVVLAKNLPSQTPPIEERHISRLREELRREEPGSAAAEAAEVQEQNHELLTAIDQLERERAEIDRLNGELAETNRGVLALYAELDEKAESLRKASEEKSRFLSNMSHEFRTPLNSIISLTQILLAEADGPLTPEQQKQVNFIRSSARSLFEMVNDLLDIAKIEAGKLPVRPTQFLLDEFISALRGMFAPQVPPEITLRYDAPVNGKLFTDEGKLSQIARNFISNALKYTERGSVSVTATLDDAWLELTVTDTGIGIAPENLDKVFLEFTQIENALQKRAKGTGLGLTLTRRLTHLLGGTISVSSEPGKGSTFTARIPRVYEVRDEPEAVTISSVMIVDDEDASRYVLRSLLPKDVSWTEVNNGPGALELLASAKYTVDLLFLDIMMPGMTGREVLEELRRSPAGAKLPVVVFSSTDFDAAEMKWVSEERAVFLSKNGVRHDQVAAAINSAVRLVRAVS